MELRFLLIPMALAVSAAMQPPQPEPPPYPVEDPGKILEEHRQTPVVPHFDQLRFGDHSSGRVRIDRSDLGGKPALVVQIPAFGGAYGWYGVLLHQRGYRLARVFPEKGAPRKDGNALAESTARGIAALLAKADKYGFDPQRIILTGSDVGGDIAALLATDPSYFERAGIPFASIKGVIIFDGAGFDLPAYLATIGHFRRWQTVSAIGTDPAVQARISALHHIEPPNAPAFLFEVDKHDNKGAAQAEAMASALTKAGSQAEIERYQPPYEPHEPGSFGYPGDPDSAGLLRFLDVWIGPP